MSTRGKPPSPTVADVGEHALVNHIRSRFPARSALLPVGIGDDAAVAIPERGTHQVLTTDALVEGIHFDRRFSALSDVGYKALAVNVSDIAAMGGTPRLALLSLMLPAGLDLADVNSLLDGFAEMAEDVDVTLAGGNVTRSPGPLVVDVTVIGSVKPRKVLTRSGGRPGDLLYVTGLLGAASAGLGWLRANAGRQDADPADPDLRECVARHRRPQPRARAGAVIGRSRAASACMDLSDGLADAVTQIAAASGTGAIVLADALPVHPGAARWFASQGKDPALAAAAGGDDYELLIAVPPRSRGRLKTAERQARGLPLTPIGELTAETAIGIMREGRLEPLPQGFVHF